MTILERFSSKTKPASNGCVEWTAQTVNGYGRFRFNGAPRLAHRVSWILNRGAIPDGMKVLHDCDNPACVFINHLHLGTQADNMSEASSRNRWEKNGKRGESHPRTKLSNKIILEMRKLYGTCFFYQKDISQRFGVSKDQTARILSRKTWRHI